MSRPKFQPDIIDDVRDLRRRLEILERSGVFQNLRMFGAGSAMLAGVAPAINVGPFKVQSGTTVISYATGGNTIAYPVAFPTGVFGTIITNGDDFAAIWTSLGASQTLSGFKVRAYDVSTTAVEHTAGTLLRLNWVAFGW